MQPEKHHLSSAEVKVEGKNEWLAEIQPMSTQQLSLIPFTTFPLFLLCSTSTALRRISPLEVVCLGKVRMKQKQELSDDLYLEINVVSLVSTHL